MKNSKQPIADMTNSPLAIQRLGGFTLVELLIVIAVIGILIGMLLPAVQNVRETARRTSCLNKIAQLSMAAQSYEYAMEHFPPGVIDAAGQPILSQPNGQHVSYIVTLLPFIDQRGMADAFDVEAGTYAAANAVVRSMQIDVLICPTAYYDMDVSNSFALTNYAGCYDSNEVPIDVDNNGMLFLNSRVTHGDIYDGSSNTLLIGEMLPEANSLGWASGTRATLRNSASLNYEQGWNTIVGALPPSQNGGFGSTHNGRLTNVGMADGSVKTIANAMDFKVFQLLGDRADGQIAKAF
ncbi:MAG: DUF1559 domain-containing protein [Planctomycetota bacterium]